MKVWMRGPLASFVDEGLRETTARQLLPEDFVRNTTAGFRDGSVHWTRLWSIVVLGHFAKRHGLSRDVREVPLAQLELASR
jgi:hypothetical protein